MIFIILFLSSFLDSLNDYILESFFLRFSPCTGKECVSIAIIDDALPETTEFFTVTLERPSGLSNRIIIDGSRGDILILDDDDGMSIQELMNVY